MTLILKGLEKIPSELRQDVVARVYPKKEVVEDWMNEAIGDRKLVPQSLIEFDSKIVDFVTNDEKVLTFEQIIPERRAWIHKRAEALKLNSESHVIRPAGKKAKKNRKNMTVSKPEGWYFDRSNPHPPMQWEHKSKRSNITDWRAKCEECMCELDAWTALFHYSGMGPMCESCIENDGELEGLKWEPKADC